MKIRVICCGNLFRGNDAAGLHVLDRIRKRCPRSEAIDGGTGGLGLIPLMEGYDRIIIVDATVGMGRIGNVQVYHDILPSWLPPDASLHDIGIAEAIAVARAVGIAPRVVLVGIEGGANHPLSEKMDPQVERAIPVACSTVLGILRKWGECRQDLH